MPTRNKLSSYRRYISLFSSLLTLTCIHASIQQSRMPNLVFKRLMIYAFVCQYILNANFWNVRISAKSSFITITYLMSYTEWRKCHFSCTFVFEEKKKSLSFCYTTFKIYFKNIIPSYDMLELCDHLSMCSLYLWAGYFVEIDAIYWSFCVSARFVTLYLNSISSSALRNQTIFYLTFIYTDMDVLVGN